MDQLEHSYFILQMVEVSLHLDLQPFEICASKYLLGKVYAALKVPFLLCWHLEINKLSYSLQGVFPLQQVNFTFSYHLNWLWLFYSIRVSFKSMTEIEHFALRTGVSSLDAVITFTTDTSITAVTKCYDHSLQSSVCFHSNLGTGR